MDVPDPVVAVASVDQGAAHQGVAPCQKFQAEVRDFPSAKVHGFLSAAVAKESQGAPRQNHQVPLMVVRQKRERLARQPQGALQQVVVVAVQAAPEPQAALRQAQSASRAWE
jgi:hypothetical protein